MRICIVGVVVSLLLAGCTARQTIDPDVAANELVQAMTADGLRYPRVADDPRFVERGGATEMHCAVEYIPATDQTVVSRSATAVFVKSTEGWKLKSYGLDSDDPFTVLADQPGK